MANVRNANKIFTIMASNGMGVIAHVNTTVSGDPFKYVEVRPEEGRANDTMGVVSACFKKIAESLTPDDHILVFVPDNQVRRINEGRKHANNLLDAIENEDDEKAIQDAVDKAREGICKDWMTEAQQESAIDLVESWQTIMCAGADVNVRSFMESYGYNILDVGSVDVNSDFEIDQDTEKIMIGDSGVVGGYVLSEIDLIDGVDQNTGLSVNNNMLQGKRMLCGRYVGAGDNRKIELFVPITNLFNGNGEQTPNGILIDLLWGWNANGVHNEGLIDVCRKHLPRLQNARVARKSAE